jgi:hypothetical protein
VNANFDSYFKNGKCRYEQSLSVLKHAKVSKKGMITKTSIMLGLGETDDEVNEAMTDLRAIDVDILTFGQYLQVKLCATMLLCYLARVIHVLCLELGLCFLNYVKLLKLAIVSCFTA